MIRLGAETFQVSALFIFATKNAGIIIYMEDKIDSSENHLKEPFLIVVTVLVISLIANLFLLNKAEHSQSLEQQDFVWERESENYKITETTNYDFGEYDEETYPLKPQSETVAESVPEEVTSEEIVLPDFDTIDFVYGRDGEEVVPLDQYANYVQVGGKVFAQQPTGLGSFEYVYLTDWTPEFEVLEAGFSRDANNAYHQSGVLPAIANTGQFSVMYKEGDGWVYNASGYFGVYEDRVFWHNVELVGLSFDTMQVSKSGHALYDDDSAWGLTGGCHFPYYIEIDREKAENHVVC